MKKRFTRWLGMMMSILMILTSTIGVAAAEGDGSASIKETKKVTVTSSYAMFKLKNEAEGVTDRQTTEGTVDIYTDGSMKLKFVYEGSSFLSIYLGSAEEAATGAVDKTFTAKSVEGGNEYELPIESLNTTFNAAVWSSKGSNWKENTLTVKEIENSTPGTDGSGTNTPETDGSGTDTPGTDGSGTGGSGNGGSGTGGSGTDTPGTDTNVPSGTTVILPNGTYSVTVETGAPMFKVTDCKLVVKNKTIQAILTLSGTGYDYLYQGTVEEAKKAGESSWSRYQISTDGTYKYVVSIPYDSFGADQVIAVAARSARNTTWYDRTLDFDLTSLAVVSASTEIDGSLSSVGSIGSTGTSGSGTGSSSGKTDNTLSSTEINNKLNTVDKDATVQDGTYVPEFGFTGGSGRATISCSQVVVKNGKATATIVFNSPNFTWVKSLGTTVYNENKGGNSTFTIPVNLNGETNISAETTAMSQPYTVDYTIYCFIDGTKVTTSNGNRTKTKSNAVIELDGTDGKAKDSDEIQEDENAWASFFDEVETTSVDTDNVAKNSHTAVIVLSVILALVCIYAVVVTFFMIKKIRRIRGE